jgi:hypothetical protein
LDKAVASNAETVAADPVVQVATQLFQLVATGCIEVFLNSGEL